MLCIVLVLEITRENSVFKKKKNLRELTFQGRKMKKISKT